MDLRWTCLGLVMAVTSGCAAGAGEDAEASTSDITQGELRMNQLQVKGTHNSYHKARFLFPSASLNYNFKPLDEQLESEGVRAVELDIHYEAGDKRFDVHHIDWDEGSTCPHFTDCLKTMKTWSDAHRGHSPIFVQLEAKDAFDAGKADAYHQLLDAQILSVWPKDRIVTPDDVKGAASGVREAITKNGWPTLDSARGKIVFYLQPDDGRRTYYTHGDKDLNGRLTFVSSGLDKPYAAFAILDDPKGSAKQIQDAVKAGFIVRTRADADLVEPKKNDHSRETAAFASGAQIVSTDFPAKDPNYDYVVKVPNGAPSRCNPLFASPSCTSQDIELVSR